MPPSVPFSLPFYREKRSDSGTRQTDNWLLLMKCLPRSCFFNRVCFFFFCSQDEVSKNEPRRFRGRTCNARPLYRRDSIMTKTAPGRTWAFSEAINVHACFCNLGTTVNNFSRSIDHSRFAPINFIILSNLLRRKEKKKNCIARNTLEQRYIFIYKIVYKFLRVR